jgi:hypothetical protein
MPIGAADEGCGATARLRTNTSALIEAMNLAMTEPPDNESVACIL